MADEMKKRYYETVTALIASKGKNNQLFTHEQYLSLINKVKESKSKITKKTPEDYQRLARYDVLNMGESERLIIPIKNEDDPIMFFAHLEETFEIIHECHNRIKHGGRDRTMKELKLNYKNITSELVKVYLNLCDSCQKRKSLPKKDVVKPTRNELSSRCLVDIIDMQSPDGDYKFIMVYEDYLTKFVQLRSLKSKLAKDVAHHLLDIFTTFGAPCILQSDGGREFSSQVVKQVCAMWPELKMVHGESNFLTSVERARDVVEKMLYTWLETNKTTQWSEGLRFIQFKKNNTYHAGINRSPHEAMFGNKAKVGLNSLTKDALVELSTEEELETMFNEDDNQMCEEKETERDTHGAAGGRSLATSIVICGRSHDREKERDGEEDKSSRHRVHWYIGRHDEEQLEEKHEVKVEEINIKEETFDNDAAGSRKRSRSRSWSHERVKQEDERSRLDEEEERIEYKVKIEEIDIKEETFDNYPEFSLAGGMEMQIKQEPGDDENKYNPEEANGDDYNY